MAEENHNGVAEMLPTFGILANDNFDQSSNPKPDVNLQLSLGRFYDKTPKSAPISPASFANPANVSVLKRSNFEQNKFLQEGVAEIKINREIQEITKPNNQEGGIAEISANVKSNEVNTLVSPLDVPIWAAQSAFGNPAFQRAINVIKSNGIPTAPISTNLRGYTPRNPHAIGGFGSQFPILYPGFNNGQPMGTQVNNGTNQRFFVLQKNPENLNLVAPANFASACRNFIPNQQSQTLNLQPSFNCPLATMARPPPHWNTNGNLMMHSVPTVPSAPSSSRCAKISFPFPASIVPQNAFGYNNPHNPSNFFPNGNTNNIANGNPLMAHQPSQPPFARPAGTIRSIPLPEVINGSRVHHNPTNPLDRPSKRARRDNRETREAAELQLMEQILPTVVTNGGNPNGKKTEGLLYKYGSDQEVTIICVCHGCFFTPEEFVRHAGGGDHVENPAQQISVLDYPDYLMK